MLTSTLIDDCRVILGDPVGDRWTNAELLTYVNAGLRDIVTRTVAARTTPAYAGTVAMKLGPGTAQNLKTVRQDALTILTIDCNLGTDWIAETVYIQNACVYYNNTRYRALEAVADSVPPNTNPAWEEISIHASGPPLTEITQENLTTLLPNWQTAESAADGVVQYWGQSSTGSRVGTAFWVYPKQSASAESAENARQYLRISYVATPPPIETHEDLPIRTVYIDPLRDYVLSRAFAKSGNADITARAVLYMQAYQQSSIFLV